MKLKQKPSVDQSLRLKSVRTSGELVDKNAVEYQKLQDHFLAMTLMQPKLRSLLKAEQAELFSGDSQTIFQFLIKHPDFVGDPKTAKELKSVADYVKIIALQFETLYQDLEFDDLQQSATRLKDRLVRSYIKDQKQHLMITMQHTSDDGELKKLIDQVDKLNQRIK